MSIRKIPPNYLVGTGRYAFKRRLPLADPHFSVDFESPIERDFLTLADFDRDVALVDGQPVRISWSDERGRTRHYTPDFLVTFLPPDEQFSPCQPAKMKPWLVETKDTQTLREKWREFRPRFRAAAQYARLQGWTFHLVTERRVRTTRLDNAKLLLPVMGSEPPKQGEPCRNALLQTLADRGGISAQNLLDAVCADSVERGRLLPQLWNLVAWRIIGTDLDLPLSMNSFLWLPEHAPRRGARLYCPCL